MKLCVTVNVQKTAIISKMLNKTSCLNISLKIKE